MYDEEDEGDDDATARMSNCSSNLDNTVPEQPPGPYALIENTRRLAITSPTRHKALQALFKKEKVD